MEQHVSPSRRYQRETVSQAPWQLEAEKRKQELLLAVMSGPRVTEQQAAQSGEAAAAEEMEAEEQQAPVAAGAAMAVDGQAPGSTTTNPDKILKKLKKARLQQVKGVVKGKKKRASIQKQGAKHFLKKKKKH
ncbi:hypothetical protein N2152v2_008387 [Parachlorella kessleri]